jgi:hypothetical protein
MMWEAFENDVAGARDIIEVIEWAEVEAAKCNSTYTLFVKLDRGRDLGLVWLAGVDPTAGTRHNFVHSRPRRV